MPIQSLAEAKAALEKEESPVVETTEVVEPEDDAPEVVQDELADDSEEKGDDLKDDPAQEESVSDDWTKGDDAEPEKGRLPDSQAAAIRRKYKAKAKEAEDKASQLEQKIADLEKQLASPKPSTSIASKPVREQFKTDAEFQEALIKHAVAEQQAQSESAMKAQQAKQARDAMLNKIAESTDAHYTRAAALAAKSNISPEAYKSADLVVRQAFEAVRPENGDALVDGMIHILGPGSERVFYKLGVNSAKRAEATKLLTEDPSGLRLVAYLSKLNAELAAPIKRETKAPDPAPVIQGDKANTSGSVRQRREYDAAMAKGDTQKAWSIKQAAKKAGISTRDWL